ncbi:hypothetical protein SAMN00808754_2400 [Thermanaeromonas toyohensis ToBE]|uniref:Uncharacterized protein n=1 Tax=Thermanaeromonas toyohensis ToBE TaxID=698762 RepID=A0A1W1W098_9FIRM|nr:hypothetical protein [Thermanaeromonas toyohensis]SMB98544.1 hypothetical protein SAMN00808754_2400 [Thermanaeromonas toyohensis ToBE]
MLVVTITNWRRKLVWVLAGLLVISVIFLGEIFSRQAARDNLPPVSTKEKVFTSQGQERSSFWEGLLVKLKEYYQGQQPRQTP